MVIAFKAAAWNANSLCQHAEKIIAFLLNHHSDIMLISTTHMTTTSYIQIHNCTYNTKHPSGKAHVGTAVSHHETDKYEHEHIYRPLYVLEDRLGPQPTYIGHLLSTGKY